jgi:hypothetical protein
MTQYQKIVTIMCRDRHRWFFPYDFMNPALGDLFVGYKAPTRIAELANDYPKMFQSRTEGKYVQRRLNPNDFQEWFAELPKSLRQIVAKELDYYPQVAA